MSKIPVVIIDREEENIKNISTLLKNISDLEVIQSGTNLKDLEALFEEKIPAIVMIGPSYRIEEMEKILKSHSAELSLVKVIFLAKEVSANLLKNAIKLNVHDVLEFPFAYNDLKESIGRVEDIYKEVLVEKPETSIEEKKHEQKSSKIIMFFSTKGGSGTSFIAANLAVDLASQNKKEVIVFDLKYQFGDIALMLNLYPKHTIYDIVSVVDQLDCEMLDSFLTVHSSGVKVLPALIDPLQGESISAKSTMKIMDILSKISDFIVIDAPSAFSDDVLSLFEKTDYLCMVTSMDVPNIKNLEISLQVLEQLKFPQEKIFLILNRAESKVGITIDEIEKTIKRKIDVRIPSNRIVPLTINRGVPVVTDAPRSAVSKSIHKLTRLLMAAEEKRMR